MPLLIPGPRCYRGKAHVIITRPCGYSVVPYCGRCGRQFPPAA